MNPEIRELYQEVIIEHGRHPRNFKKLENANHTAQGDNPLCGDKLVLYLYTENNIITDISFEGTGCAISMASASLMTDALKGKTIETAKEVFDQFHDLLTQKNCCNKEELGKLKILEGVKEFPMRVKCATLAWHTLLSALEDKHQTISTE